MIPALDALDTVAVPMVALDGDGMIRGANHDFATEYGQSAHALVGQAFSVLVDAQDAHSVGAWQTVALALRGGERLDGLPIGLRKADGSAWALRLSLRPAGPLSCLTLTDRSAELRADRLDELLALAQKFGRIGTWERDARTLQGQWDPHMRRFWGLSPDAPTPHLSLAATYVVPEDREGMYRYSLASTQQPGRYSRHFSVLGADGVRRRLHSQWEVKIGADGKPARMLGVVMDDTDVLKMAKAVDEARAQLELAVQVSGLATWRHDLATNRLFYDDQGWRILGREPRPDGLSLPEVRDLIHPDDLPAVQAALERSLLTDGPVDMQARYRHADGRWLDVLTRRVTQRDDAGRPVAFIGVAIDLSARMDEQRRLDELARRLELAASATGVAIWSLDVATRQVQWNDQMYALHGLDPSEPPPAMEHYINRFVPEAFRAQMWQSLTYLAADGRNRFTQADVRILRTDGTVRDVSVRTRAQHTASGLRLMGTLIDITDQLAERQALREAHARVALAARAVGFGIWDRDDASGRATWDEQMWRLRGLEPRGSDAPSYAEHIAMVHPDDRHALELEYESAKAEQRPWSVEFRVRWPDGSWHWLSSRSTPVFDAQGRETRRLGVNWDITDARNAAAARQEQLAAQRESQAKSRFLARMSHELRTPLHAVIGFAQLLQSDDVLRWHADARERVHHIRAAGEHLLALVDDVLDLSRLDAGEIRLDARNVALRETLEAVLPMVAAQAEAAEVGIVCAAVDVTLHADATRLRQILLNLLTNAVKYNRRGGRVELNAHVDGDDVVLSVSDTGRGMNEQQLAHVFEPFNRLGMDREGIEGTGIGLAIVKINVERMGGRVSVASKPGQGSRFEVRLPAGTSAAPAEPVGDAPPPVSAPATGPGHARVLYIEDNPVNALIVRELIAQRQDLILDEAADGLSGIEIARRSLPNLILLDMQLPDIDGMEVLRRLRHDPLTASIPCIALSANAMPDDIQTALGAGFADYWTKPLDFRVFLNALDSLFGKAA